jgi:AcrR family transcriptional regulator
MEHDGLRARKKAATRRHISDVATRLFAQRGFDAVTVEEVARAADVSKMTVFNYFPRKEDLVLDREDELLALVRGAASRGIPGLRGLFLDLAVAGHPILGAVGGAPAFWALVSSSPALVARWWAMLGAVEDAIAAALPGPRDEAAVVAAMITGVWRAVSNEGLRRIRAGDDVGAIRARQAELLRAGFASVEGMHTGRGDRSPSG